MAPSTPTSCPHELRPGTTVCLHCRRAAREAASLRTRTLAGKVVLVGVLIAVAAAGGVAALGAVDGKDTFHVRELAARLNPAATNAVAAVAEVPAASKPPQSPASSDSTPSAGADSLAQPVAFVAPVATVPGGVEMPADPAPPAALAPAPTVMSQSVAAVGAPLPLVGEGHTPFPDSMFAVRRGDTVTVRFDTELWRTRRPEKFEQIVRATLPRVHGALADSVLAGLPLAYLVRNGDLLTELPLRGIRLAAANGLTLTVWPETRPGRDGPLVVAYRTTVSR